MEIATIHLDLQPRQRLCHLCPLESLWRGPSQGKSAWTSPIQTYLCLGLLRRMYPSPNSCSLFDHLADKRLGTQVPPPRSDRVPCLARNNNRPLISAYQKQANNRPYVFEKLYQMNISKCLLCFLFIFKCEVRQ